MLFHFISALVAEICLRSDYVSTGGTAFYKRFAFLGDNDRLFLSVVGNEIGIVCHGCRGRFNSRLFGNGLFNYGNFNNRFFNNRFFNNRFFNNRFFNNRFFNNRSLNNRSLNRLNRLKG